MRFIQFKYLVKFTLKNNMSEFRPYPKQGTKPKKDAKPIKRTRIKYKKKDSGQISVFENIAETREWACFCCGIKLWQLTATSFSHLLPKALNKYPLYKTYDRNIILLCDKCHYTLDHQPRSIIINDPKWEKVLILEKELKAQYPKII